MLSHLPARAKRKCIIFVNFQWQREAKMAIFKLSSILKTSPCTGLKRMQWRTEFELMVTGDGDQFTEEWARNVRWTFKNGLIQEESLGDLEPTFSEFIWRSSEDVFVGGMLLINNFLTHLTAWEVPTFTEQKGSRLEQSDPTIIWGLDQWHDVLPVIMTKAFKKWGEAKTKK